MKRKTRATDTSRPSGDEAIPLADQVRTWRKHQDKKARGAPDLLFTQQGSTTSVEFCVRDVERLRRRFPRQRVNEAWRILEAEGPDRRGSKLADGLSEQVYRAHYSSLKIQCSWRRTVTATRALARLFDVEPGATADAGGPDGSEQEYLRTVWSRLWPSEKLDELLALVAGEQFYGHIPLKTGALVLGLRLAVDEYARALVRVLRRLHQDDSYTYGLCVGRTLSWDEAMLFKALPEGAGTGQVDKGGADAQPGS